MDEEVGLYRISGATLAAIAQAIRNKTGESEVLSPAEMARKIQTEWPVEWVGTLEAYQALETKDSNTRYYIVEEN